MQASEKRLDAVCCEGRNTLTQRREEREKRENEERKEQEKVNIWLRFLSFFACPVSILKNIVHVKSYARPAPPGLEGGPAPHRWRALKGLQARCRRCSASVLRRGPRQGRCGDAEAARGEGGKRKLSRRRRRTRKLEGLKNSKPMPWWLRAVSVRFPPSDASIRLQKSMRLRWCTR